MNKMPLTFQAECPAYALNPPLEEENDYQNLESLKDDFLEKEKFETQYTCKDGKALSSEFKFQLGSFFGIFWVCILVHFTGKLISYAFSDLETAWLIAHTVFESFHLLLSVLLFKRIFHQKFIFRHHRLMISIIFSLYSTYLLAGDELLSSDQTSLLLVLVLYVSLRSALLSSFFYTSCVSVYLMLLFLVVLILPGKSSNQWSGFLFLTIASLKQLLDAYVMTKRINKLFAKDKYTRNSHFEEFTGEQAMTESLSVIQTLKMLRNTIIDVKVKEKIQDSLQSMRKMSMTLNNKMSLTFNFANLDEDERLFLNQYCFKEQPEKLNNDVYCASRNLHTPEGFLNKFGNDWSFDALFLSKITPNAIQTVGEYISETLGIPVLLDVSESLLSSFHLEIDKGYNPMPYHNNSHACDVAHSVLFIVTKGELSLGNIDLYSMLLAALAHDLGHRGVTNRFLASTKHDIALVYNDMSVQENMHCYLLYKLICKYGIFENLPVEDYKSIRKTIIEMILSTDMSKHFEQLGVFKMKAPDLNLDSQADCILLYSIILKCADIGHTAKPNDLHQAWTLRVVEEFFKQGDLERKEGLPISMYCDRENTDLAKSQYGFIKNIAYPLFKALGNFLDSEAFDEVCINQLVVNKEFWMNGGGNRRNSARLRPYKEFVIDSRRTT